MRKLLIICITTGIILSGCAEPKNNHQISEKTSYSKTIAKEEFHFLSIYVFEENRIYELHEPKITDTLPLHNMITYQNNNSIELFSVSEHKTISEATNQVSQMKDLKNTISNLLLNMGEIRPLVSEIVTPQEISKYITISPEEFTQRKTYILVDKTGKIIAISIYKSSMENLMKTLIEIIEDIGWDKTLSINLTEKYIKDAYQGLNSLKTNKILTF